MDGEYDEFGNYIGQTPESDGSEGGSSDSSSSSSEEEAEEEEEADVMDIDEDNHVAIDASRALVLQEDRQHYADNDEVYGAEAEVIVGEEDAQPIEQPIIAPKVDRTHLTKEKEKGRKMTHQDSYLSYVLKHPTLVRNVTVAGHLAHGKTSFMDYVMNETGRVTDTRLDEQQRGMSVKAAPVSTLLESNKGKEFAFNMLDTPGHSSLVEEAVASMRLSDGVVLVVDVVEGMMMSTEKVLLRALAEGLPLVLVLNKIDRLILELRIPPVDAYAKICHVLAEINQFVAQAPLHPSRSAPPRFSPERDNVLFASAKYDYSFSLRSFARIYRDFYGGGLDVDRFAKRLWGSIYYNAETRKFSRERDDEDDPPSFVTFILEPLYKLTSIVVAEEGKALGTKLADGVGVKLWRHEAKLDADPLLKVVAGRFFKDPSGFVDMVLANVPNPAESAKARVPWVYTGPVSGDAVAEGMLACDAEGPLVVHVTKLLYREDGTGFDSLGRVMSGTMRAQSQVRVLGENYSEDNPENMAIAEANRLWIPQGRHRLEVTEAPAGTWVLIEGVDGTIEKTATICARDNESVAVFKPLDFGSTAVIKLAVEPLLPRDLPQMVEGLTKVNKSYPMAKITVEESGEHVILGTGELHLDCIMHDLRRLFTEVEIKVADPVTKFCETVIETSSLQCFGETPNKKNKITMIAEPLDKGLADEIESKAVTLDKPKDARQFFETKYGWDTLTARSVWAFGPDTNGPNVLLDDTIAGEVVRKDLNAIKDSVILGYQWGTGEGPLCDEQIRNVKFKLVHADVASDPMQRGSQQIWPTTRRVAYSAFLMATPRLMEPWYAFEVICPEDCLGGVQTIVSTRRGYIFEEVKKPGTPLFVAKGSLPAMDSFGFETDVRTHTWGQAFVQTCFHEWSIVPGDPLDKDIVLRPLEPSRPAILARDYLVKTRRRKGLSEDVSINKYFDDPMLLELAKQEVDLGL